MTLAHVMLICVAGIAACAALVFTVETVVAFCFHEQEQKSPVVLRHDFAASELVVSATTPVEPLLLTPVLREPVTDELRMDKAA